MLSSSSPLPAIPAPPLASFLPLPLVIPAKAGIQRGGARPFTLREIEGGTDAAGPPPHAQLSPSPTKHSSVGPIRESPVPPQRELRSPPTAHAAPAPLIVIPASTVTPPDTTKLPPSPTLRYPPRMEPAINNPNQPIDIVASANPVVVRALATPQQGGSVSHGHKFCFYWICSCNATQQI